MHEKKTTEAKSMVESRSRLEEAGVVQGEEEEEKGGELLLVEGGRS